MKNIITISLKLNSSALKNLDVGECLLTITNPTCPLSKFIYQTFSNDGPPGQDWINLPFESDWTLTGKISPSAMKTLKSITQGNVNNSLTLKDSDPNIGGITARNINPAATHLTITIKNPPTAIENQ